MMRSHGRRSDQITRTVTVLCLAVMAVLMAMNGMVELGATAHDAFCPEHGWAV